MAATLKGVYNPDFKGKYIGNSYPIFRSAWEKRVMFMLDHNEKVYRWGSELFPLPYFNPLDGKIHQYFPDFYVESIGSSGTMTKLIVEVKPKKQTIPPVIGNKRKKTINIEMTQWLINKAKWESAQKYCQNHGMKFMILTEDDIGI